MASLNNPSLKAPLLTRILSADLSFRPSNRSSWSSPPQLNGLNSWQKSKLHGISPQGIQCYLKAWSQSLQNPIKGPYCDVAWDEIYCWPATRAGENVSMLCSEVMKYDPEIPNAADIAGSAFRLCSLNGTWGWEGWTNYNQCMESLAYTLVPGSEEGFDLTVVNAVRFVLLIGSIFSVVAILTSLLIFYYFKCLRCDRITIQIHLMLALLLRSLLMLIISEPFVFQRETNNYRTVNWICKAAMGLYMVTTAMSTNWMFIHGHFLHSRVTTDIFSQRIPFPVYFSIGWGFPILPTSLWVYAMELDSPTYCWKNYGQSKYIWVIVGPMISALVVNLLFLINILRILLTKVRRASVSSDWAKFRRAVKATMVLGPVFGVNNLLFCYNPGGNYEAVYMVTNAVFQATQGFFVAMLYCFFNTDVHQALQREYARYKSRRFRGNESAIFAMRDRKSVVRHFEDQA